MSPAYATPLVNLNGSSRESLLEKEGKVLTALVALQEALREAYPHGRDYQISPIGTFEKASAEAAAEFDLVHQIVLRHEAIVSALHDYRR